MRLKCAAVAVVMAALVSIIAPSDAIALTPHYRNELGEVFAGQADVDGRQCLSCHDAEYGATLHGRHVTTGITAQIPAAWTQFMGSGSVTTNGSPKPGTGLRWYTQGGVYSISGLTWMTLFDYTGGSRWSEEEAPLMFFSGSPATSTASPWLRVSGLGLTHEGTNVEYLQTTTALSDNNVSSTCGMVNCHFTGGTQPLAANQSTLIIPNPAVKTQLTTQTPTQWMRDSSFSAIDFRTTASVSYGGLGVQCEKCHGTGLDSDDIQSRHWNTGTQLSHRLPAATVGTSTVAKTSKATLGRSDVCGVCHGLRSAPAVAGTVPFAFGYTPNLFVRDFVSVNAPRGSNAPYTYTPTAGEFAANPAIYALYPSGNPKTGGHGGNQYWAWAASAHAVRVQTATNDPDQLPGASQTHFSITGVTTLVECLRCHTGEGYLTSKVAQISSSRAITSIWDGFQVTKASAGFMGQECVVCHDPHPSASDAAHIVRAADPAGVRSNFGRATSNAGMCEDCHNWQVEVLANGLPLADFNPQSLPGRVSHPQREVLHGTMRGTAPVMWEVDDMGEFMPGAQCQDCHMPKTDTGAEYSSHRMMIQMPGDAAAWGATGEDSCTRCHEEAGDTIVQARAILQSRIDQWQASASAAGVAAKSALDAAKLRPEFASGSAGAKELYGRAWLNWNSFSNDGSNGVHNPPYLMAGLTVAKKMADSVGGFFGQQYATGQMTIGSLGSVSARLNNGDGTNAMGAAVTLERWSGTAWLAEGLGGTDRNGNVAFMISPPLGPTTYRLRWDRCSNSNADLYSASMTVNVVKIPSRTTLAASARTISLGKRVRLYGAVTPPAAGQVVTIQVKKGSGSWKRLATTTLSSTSRFSRYVKPGSTGKWYYRARYAGTATVAGSVSPTVRVVVR